MKIKPISDYHKVNGTSYWGGQVPTTVAALEANLGIKAGAGDGYKVFYEFELELEDGTPFTIYDWKEWHMTEHTKVYFHIGAHSAEDSRKALQALSELGFHTCG